MTTENQNPETAQETAQTQNIEINLDTDDKNELVEKAMLLVRLGSQMLDGEPLNCGKKRKVVIDLNARITIK